jgi:hypothetical protein
MDVNAWDWDWDFRWSSLLLCLPFNTVRGSKLPGRKIDLIAKRHGIYIYMIPHGVLFLRNTLPF